MAYTPEVQAKIDALEEELATLKKKRVQIVDEASMQNLYEIFGGYWGNKLRDKIIYISKLFTCSVAGEKPKNNAFLTFEEITKAKECALEIISFLENISEKYMRND